MTRSRTLTLGLLLVAVLALVVAVVVTRQPAPGPGSAATTLVREDSPRLTGGDEVQVVEYLDFECESCLLMHPFVEDLKETYGDRIELVVRYLPLHVSSVNAALAAEAAGNQGAYEEMYDRLFAGAEEWGHQQTPEREQFFVYAEELGLDMERFTADFDAPATLAVVEQSEADARANGVTSTPTFFVDGERLELTRTDDVARAVAEALGD
ncbi:DsbA family protein [Litorihabitans aurantiacus]|uniref:Thioredoxin domain-containing protein n=1 Tax=Litorihabitans aurantiacus TaxID=1930061 RepID=A0AA37XGW8_9MICO|nr:thioredoxin domain-containing protein [Litorihabitans aurantiacus]GMA33032.1 hypothetical protein GCM10025875_30240 [Litorihabitans aurantiacus]